MVNAVSNTSLEDEVVRYFENTQLFVDAVYQIMNTTMVVYDGRKLDDFKSGTFNYSKDHFLKILEAIDPDKYELPFSFAQGIM